MGQSALEEVKENVCQSCCPVIMGVDPWVDRGHFPLVFQVYFVPLLFGGTCASPSDIACKQTKDKYFS